MRRNIQTELQWKPDGQWLLRHQLTTYQVRLSTDSLITPWLTILNFKSNDGRKFTVTIVKDNINKEDFRRLRVRLKVEARADASHATITT